MLVVFIVFVCVFPCDVVSSWKGFVSLMFIGLRFWMDDLHDFVSKTGDFWNNPRFHQHIRRSKLRFYPSNLDTVQDFLHFADLFDCCLVSGSDHRERLILYPANLRWLRKFVLFFGGLRGRSI